MNPHKHAKQIHAWADGATIERYCGRQRAWTVMETADWHARSIYRVKPDCPYVFCSILEISNDLVLGIYQQWINGKTLQLNRQNSSYVDSPSAEEIADPFYYFKNIISSESLVSYRIKPKLVRKYMWNLICTTTDYPTPYMTRYCAENELPTPTVCKPYKKWVKSDFYVEVEQ